MPRVKRGFKARRRHNRILKLAKGYRGSHSRLFRSAVEAVERGLCYAYRDRRQRKRAFRRLWIVRINAAVRAHGRSLLPIGITSVEGDFAEGDPVRVIGPDGVEFARGLARHDAATLRAVAGQRSADHAAPEAVHRDDLVVLRPIEAVVSGRGAGLS